MKKDKNYVVVLMIVVLSFLGCSKDDDVYYPTKGLVSYFPFDTDFADKQGYMTLKSGSASFDVGKLGKAASFNGINEFLEYNQSSFLNGANSFTFSCWINSKQTAKTLVFFESFDFRFNIFNNKIELVMKTTLEPSFSFLDVEIIPSNWNHLIVTYDGSIVSIFLNNQLKKSKVKKGIPQIPEFKAFILSKSLFNSFSVWSGQLDELFVYNRKLEPEEIARLYNLK